MLKLILGTFGWQGILAAVAAVILAIGGAYEIGHWRGEDAGRESERAAALERSMELIRKRSETNEEVNDLDDAGLCAALGGLWVQSEQRCE